MATTLPQIWLAIGLLLAFGSAQSLIPTNWTSAQAAGPDDHTVMMQISVGQRMVPLATLLALTDKAADEIPVCFRQVS